jgi:hypothetical protein
MSACVECVQLSGTLPETLGDLPQLWRIRVQRNKLTGTIPQSLRCVDMLRPVVGGSATIACMAPCSQLVDPPPPPPHPPTHAVARSKLAANLNELWIDNNDFEGDLSALGPTKLMQVLVRFVARIEDAVWH